MCPCGSLKQYEECCGPLISGSKMPETAEQLMRSRYTAFVRAEINYIRKTLSPEGAKDFDEAGARTWATESKWKGLKILSTEQGTASDTKGVVEFVATYEHDGHVLEHHEVSKFRKTAKGQWLYVDGDAHVHEEGQGHHHHAAPVTVVRESPKIGRNDPCPCGSGKKYKKCHGIEA